MVRPENVSLTVYAILATDTPGFTYLSLLPSMSLRWVKHRAAVYYLVKSNFVGIFFAPFASLR